MSAPTADPFDRLCSTAFRLGEVCMTARLYLLIGGESERRTLVRLLNREMPEYPPIPDEIASAMLDRMSALMASRPHARKKEE